MTQFVNEKFDRAIKFEESKVPPIWMMRQAGRYHRHYQNLRSKYSFMQLCKEPELAAEVALGPVADFDFDVSILFSDLLFPLEALGFGLSYPEGVGPQLGWHLGRTSDFEKLKSVEEAKSFLSFQAKAVKATREVLPKSKSLIGFVGGPLTLFSYATGGRHDGNLTEMKVALFGSLWQQFAPLMTQLLKENIQLQLEAGAEIVMIFDTSAGEIAPIHFSSLVSPYLGDIFKTFPGKLGYYAKSTGPEFYEAPCFKAGDICGLGYDHKNNLPKILSLKNSSQDKKVHHFTQGNFDQSLLFLDRDSFKKELENYLGPFIELGTDRRKGWVCGLGHGILPKTPEENVRTFVSFTREKLSKP